MSNKIKIVMGVYLDENDKLMDRSELNKRISDAQEEIAKLKVALNHCGGLDIVIEELEEQNSNLLFDKNNLIKVVKGADILLSDGVYLEAWKITRGIYCEDIVELNKENRNE